MNFDLGDSKHISFYVDDIKRMLPQKESCEGVCMTPECVKTAARVITFLDESVDPCKNFYRFACGGWLRSHVLPEDHFDVSVATDIEQDVKLKLKALVEKKLDETEPPAFVKMIKDFYDSCMDEDTIDKLGSEPLKKDLERLGGWPVVEGSKWNESNFDWVDTLIAFRRLGYDFNMLTYISIYSEEVDRTTDTIHLVFTGLTVLGMESLIHGLNDSETAYYYEMGVKEAVHLGADVNRAKKELLDVLRFQTELAKIPMHKEDETDANEVYKEYAAAIHKDMTPKRDRKTRERRDAEEEKEKGYFSKYTVAELQNMIPEIPWLKYFNGLLNDEIRETENIKISNPMNLKRLANLLEKTEKRVVANYMFWRIVDENWSYLSKKLRDTDQESEVRRKDKCFEEVYQALPIAFGLYYIRHFFKEDRKNAVMELVKYIHRDFLRILDEADWMDDVTKKEAIEKANRMKTFIGYRNDLLNDTEVMKIYENITICNSSYYRNVINIRKCKKDIEFSSLKNPDIKDQLEAYAQVTKSDALYNDRDNSIEFRTGMMQGVFFEKDRPHYMNFGGLGSIIGHEITHGFDASGKEYDKDGNKVDWWDKNTEEEFHKRVRCIIEQYSNYTLEDGMKLNGDFTKDDDIADNGGLKAAYRAYQSWVKYNGPEPLLPGVGYNQDQLFWISFSHIYCKKVALEDLRRNIMHENDPHSPSEHRVIGSVSNLPEFSEDFNCPPGSPMNRENKCHVW